MTVRDMKKITSNDEALKLFEESSIKHSEASETGEYKKCNKNHDIIIACILYLYDSQQLKLLEPFLEHPHVGVRLWAAFVLLSIEREKADFLKKISFSAELLQRMRSFIVYRLS